MISDQIALQPFSSTAATRTRRTPGGSCRLTAIGAVASRVGGAIRKWAKAPLLPYAMLWEASVLMAILKDRQYFEPDPLAAERPFLSDLWLRS